MEIQVEELLGSKGKVKVLRTLALDEELSITLIIQKTGLNHGSVEKHLDYFKRVGLVQEKRFGRIRIFRYKSENLKARSFKNFIGICEGVS